MLFTGGWVSTICAALMPTATCTNHRPLYFEHFNSIHCHCASVCGRAGVWLGWFLMHEDVSCCNFCYHAILCCKHATARRRCSRISRVNVSWCDKLTDAAVVVRTRVSPIYHTIHHSPYTIHLVHMRARSLSLSLSAPLPLVALA